MERHETPVPARSNALKVRFIAAQPGRAGTAGDRKAPARTGQQAGVILQDPNLHELVLTMPDSAPQIGATYGTDPGSTKRILDTVRPDGTRQAAARAPTPEPTGPVLAGNPVPVPPTTPGSTLPGFDTCAPPSLSTMKAWRAKYAATNIADMVASAVVRK